MTPARGDAARRLLVGAVISALVGAALLLVGIGLLSLINRAFLAHLNSDLFYIAAFLRDLRTPQIGVARWNLPPAPYFFPDMALLLPITLLLGDLGLCYHVYGVVLFGLFVAAWGLLYREVVGPRAPSAALLAALLFVAALQGAHPVLLVAVLPIFHAGALCAGTWLLWLTAVMIRRGPTRRGFLAVSLLAGLSAASDLFFVLQFLIPLLLTLLVLQRSGRISAAVVWCWASAIACAGVVAVVLLALWGRFSPIRFEGNAVLANLQHLLSLRGLGAGLALALGLLLCARFPRAALRGALALVVLAGVAVALRWASVRALVIHEAPAGWPREYLRRFSQDMLVLARQSPLLFLAILVAGLLALWRCGRGLDRRTADAGGGVALFVVLACLLSAGLTTVVVALYWNYLSNDVYPALTEHGVLQVGVIRHMQTAWVQPLFLIAFLLLSRERPWSLGARPLWSLRVGAVLVAGSMILPQAAALRRAELRLPYPSYSRCLDQLASEQDLHAGYGHYWFARHLSMLSRRGLTINQLSLGRFTPDSWVNNRERFARGELSAGYPRYDFFITGFFTREELLARFGPPAQERLCHGVPVLVYNRPGDLAFRNFIRVPALLDAGRAPPTEVLGLPEGNRWRSDGAALPAPQPADALVLPFARPVRGDVLELSADGAHAFAVTLQTASGATYVAQVPQVLGPGCRARFVRLPRDLGAIIQATVRRSAGVGPAAVAHLFVYQDS